MQTTNSDNLFKSDAQIAKEAGREEKLIRTQAFGDPVKLTSKPLGLLIKGDEAWAAESGFILRRFSLITGKSSIVYKGHSAPVTCLAFYDLPSSSDAPIRRFLLSGSWDKTIKVWDRDTGICLSTTLAHTDFVKCLLPLPNLPTPILLSGSSDKSIRVMSLASLASSPSSPLEQLQSLQEHTRPIKRLASVPQSERDQVDVYSADSMGKIILWRFKTDGEQGVDVIERQRWSAHETSITDLCVEEDGIWTASMDTHVHYHPFSPASSTSSSAKIVFPQPSIHPQPAPHALLPLFHLTPPILLTGSSDEFIRVWDLSAGEASGQARLIHEVEGHCADVTGLARWVKDREEWVVSWALDGTVRRWKLADLLRPPPPPPVEEKKDDLPGGITEEEARELAELMSDEE